MRAQVAYRVQNAARNLIRDGTQTYVYDLEHHLTCVVGTDGTCTSASAMNHAGHALGQRAEKLQGSAGAAQVDTYAMQGQVLTVHDGSGNLLRSEFYTGGRHVGVFSTQAAPQSRQSGRRDPALGSR
jgi:hypothetical protein